MSDDYEADPGRYRLGMAVTEQHASASLYALAAQVLTDRDVRSVLDVGCADGVLRAALAATSIRLVGLDPAASLLAAHPEPVVRARAECLPFGDGVFDAVTALNVLYHLDDPRPALREAARVVRPGGILLAATVSRDDSPELWDHWRRPGTAFDAEDAPALVAETHAVVDVLRWDAPLVTLPDAAAVRDYLLGRQAPPEAAASAAAELRTPLAVTKRGVLVVATPRG